VPGEGPELRVHGLREDGHPWPAHPQNFVFTAFAKMAILGQRIPRTFVFTE
jgi:hypothetical protein